MAVGGVPDLNSNHAERTVLAGKQMLNFVKGINLQQEAVGKEPWHMRIGIHTGPIIAGSTSSQFDVWGDTVNIASRIEAINKDAGTRLLICLSAVSKNNLDSSAVSFGASPMTPSTVMPSTPFSI